MSPKHNKIHRVNALHNKGVKYYCVQRFKALQFSGLWYALCSFLPHCRRPSLFLFLDPTKLDSPCDNRSMSSVPGLQRKPPRSATKLKAEAKVALTLPSIVASTRTPPGGRRKIYPLAEELDAWLRVHDATGDIQAALKVGFEVSIPRWFIALSLKADAGDVLAIKTGLEWWKQWKTEELAQTLNVTPDRKAAAGWVVQSVEHVTSDVTPAGTPERVTPEVTRAGDAANTGESDTDKS